MSTTRQSEPRRVYGVYRNSDLTEGRGPMVLIGLFEREEDTDQARRGYAIMGVKARDIQDSEVRELTVFSSYEQWAASLSPQSLEGKIHRPGVDPEYAEYLRLQKKFGGRS